MAHRSPSASNAGLLESLARRITTRHADVVVVLDRAELTLGRGGHNAMRIDSEVVSGTHARLTLEDSTYRYVHVSRTNPTLLHGVPITDVLLHDGDRLEIGPGTSEAVTISEQFLAAERFTDVQYIDINDKRQLAAGETDGGLPVSRSAPTA